MHDLFSFIQARSGSSRLPNKVFKTIPIPSENTILDHIYKRLNLLLPKEQIVFLIPESDNRLNDFLKERGYLYFSGSEENVYERYRKAAEYYSAKEIIRLTGDNPFIDPEYLELLIETFNGSDADIMSFSHLPLGTTGEIFKYESLVKKTEDTLESRHLEHVTLHLKEEPLFYKFTKIQPLYSDAEKQIADNIRITIDEEPDYQLANLIYERSSKQNPFFGIKEILNLYSESPELFKTNYSVKQITFNVQFSSMNKGSIYILYAEPKIYGSGHYERCKYLYLKLQSIGYLVEWGTSLPSESYPIYIIDHRDYLIPKEIRNNKIVLIDNFGPDAEHYPTYYALPHPKLDWNESIQNLLIPAVLQLFSGAVKKQEILVYAGNLPAKISEYLDEFIVKLGMSVFRIGGTPPIIDSISYISRLSKFEFYSKLASSEYFISYFGVSIFEALYFKTKVLTFSISDYHSELSQYLKEKIGCLYMGNIYTRKLEIPRLDTVNNSIVQIPTGGYTTLLHFIERFL